MRLDAALRFLSFLRHFKLMVSVSIDKKRIIKNLIILLKLNAAIENDETLGRGFRIGHSYFCTDKVIDDMWLNSVITYEIVPLLNEYWFDEPNKVREWEYVLHEAIR